jgi:hypothetical protein
MSCYGAVGTGLTGRRLSNLRVRGTALLLSGQYVCRDRPSERLTPTGGYKSTRTESNQQERRRNRMNYERRAGDTTTVEFPVIVVQEPTEIHSHTDRGRSMVLQEPREIELGVDLCPGEQQLI